VGGLSEVTCEDGGSGVYRMVINRSKVWYFNWNSNNRIFYFLKVCRSQASSFPSKLWSF